MFIFIIMGMLVLSGCMTVEEQARYQAEQEWRAVHPVEAAQKDLMEAQTAAEYQNLFKPKYSQPTPKPRCGYVSVNGRLHHVCQ